MMKIVRKNMIAEDAPTNSVGSGNIAGVGIGPQGEPGVKRGKFVGNDTFKLPRLKYNSFLANSKKDRKWWSTYLGEDDDATLQEIRDFARRKPKSPIIFEDEESGACFFARYGKS